MRVGEWESESEMVAWKLLEGDQEWRHILLKNVNRRCWRAGVCACNRRAGFNLPYNNILLLLLFYFSYYKTWHLIFIHSSGFTTYIHSLNISNFTFLQVRCYAIDGSGARQSRLRALPFPVNRSEWITRAGVLL